MELTAAVDLHPHLAAPVAALRVLDGTRTQKEKAIMGEQNRSSRGLMLKMLEVGETRAALVEVRPAATAVVGEGATGEVRTVKSKSVRG